MEDRERERQRDREEVCILQDQKVMECVLDTRISCVGFISSLMQKHVSTFEKLQSSKPLVSEINERRPITKRSKRSKNLPRFERLRYINNLWLFPTLMLCSTLSVSMIRLEILTNNTRMQRVDRDSRVLEISGQLLGVQDVGELRLAVSSKASPRVRSLKVEIGPGKQK
jgi:predicted YcjX-like family ATPase